MNTYAPDYYTEFKCIADKCTHSCCIGWEIDIDRDTLDYYKSLKGSIARRLDSAISREGEPHFELEAGDRCPFLNKNGLCDLICELGEDALCDICTDHPRFRNFYSNSVEIGLGLCCEAAAGLILGRREPFKIISLETDGKDNPFSEEEQYVLNVRSKLIRIMQNRALPIFERHNAILAEIGAQMPDKSINDWCDFYLTLERLSDNWTDALNNLKKSDLNRISSDEETDTALEQLTIYFLYRHMPSAVWDGDIASKVKFAVLSCQLIWALSTRVNPNELPLIHCCRMYSSEIEYSDENLDSIFMELAFL